MTSKPGNDRSAQRAKELADQFKQNQDQLASEASSVFGGDRFGTRDAPPNVFRPALNSFKKPEVPHVHVPQPPQEAFLDEERERLEAERAQMKQHGAYSPEFAANLAKQRAQFVTGDAVQASSDEDYNKAFENPVETPRVRATKPLIQDNFLGKKPDHPLVKALRRDLGIASVSDSGEFQPVDVSVGGFKWSMVRLSPDMSLMASEIASEIAPSAGSLLVLTEQLGVCCSILAIDGVPLWEVFSIEVPEELSKKRGLFPASPIRKLQSLRLFTLIQSDLHESLIDKLVEAHKAKVDVADLVKGHDFNEHQPEPPFEWTCPTEGCEHLLFKPAILDGDGNLRAYYCEVHGVPMLRNAPVNLRKELNPLT